GSYLGDCPTGGVIEHGDCYVADNGNSGVSVLIEDGGPVCAVDQLSCRYQVWWEASENDCDNVGGFYDLGWCRIDVDDFTNQVDIVFEYDSTHRLYIYCQDALGNIVEHWETFLVDSTPPTTTKTYKDPLVQDWYPKGCYEEWADQCSDNPECIAEHCTWAKFITNQTQINLTAEDEKVGIDVVQYRVSGALSDNFCLQCDNWMNMLRPDIGDWNTYSTLFTIPEESCHVIEYRSVDLLGNEEDINWQCVFVDNTPPEVSKEVGEPQLVCETEGCDYFISSATPITLSCADGDPHPVDHVSLWYRYRVSDDCQTWGNWTEWVDPQAQPNGLGPYVVEKEIFFPESSCHELEYYCEDGLGNQGPIFSEIDIVDAMPPNTTKTYLGPFYVNGSIDWIDTASRINLTTVDPEPHPSGVRDIFYRYTLVEDSLCSDTCVCEQSPVSEVFDLTGDVDGTVTKVDNGDSFTWFIDIASDNIPHGVWGTGMAFATSPDQPAFQVYYAEFGDDVWHYQDYGTGWNGADTTILPEGILVIGDQNGRNFSITIPKSMLGGTCMQFYWAVQARTNLLGKYPATWPQWSGGPDEVAGMATGITGTGGDWNIYSEPFGIPEESCHLIEFYSIDEVDNDEEVDWQCVFVDKTHPTIEKTLGEPQWNIEGDIFIGPNTPIYITAYDDGDHPSGLDYAEYRITQVDGANCRDDEVCQTATGNGTWLDIGNGTVFAGEQSCHLIEIRAFDKVQKNSTHKQCHFVDTTPPYTNKSVGEPKAPMSVENSELGELFYPGLNETCQTPEVCWDITLLTEIDLECVDPEPHPSGPLRACFLVTLDGEDATYDYCQSLSGAFNLSGDSYCCVEAGTKFKFNEETWHELDYYCEDRVGNKGGHDVEYFKVDGTTFGIELYKKWNLISVPFVLKNDDPAEVFEDVAANVDTVWTYDSVSGDWLVWNPDGPSSLEHIKPGWGYWILMLDDDVLELSGSLFQPAVLPSARLLQPGWNLIGYYGASWELYQYMEDRSFMCGDYFETPERWIFGDKAYCALNSLIDTQQGYPKWSSLWSYLNCGDHIAGWLGLNACVEGIQGEIDRMYAGRGYWVEMDIEDIYAPATVCIWNENNVCQLTGGGFIP
ncbi:hypothetical protein ACFL1B_05145, partial [Nanoarchaeota archaeon]